MPKPRVTYKLNNKGKNTNTFHNFPKIYGQSPNSRCQSGYTKYVSYLGPKILQLPVNATVNWRFRSMQVIWHTFLYECRTKCKNYIQNIRRYSTIFCSLCDTVPRICARLKMTGVFVRVLRNYSDTDRSCTYGTLPRSPRYWTKRMNFFWIIK
jgi:hypothetical protein